MNKKLILTISVIIGLIFLSYPEVSKGTSDGSPGGKSNSPLDGGNCTGCHSSQLNSGQGSVIITSDMQNNEYVPGETYTITVSSSHPSFTTYGFELTAENQTSKSGNFTIVNSSQTKLLNGGTSVTHKSSGTLGSATKTWSVNWTAPGFASSLGFVDFYVCALNGNGNVNNSGDEVHTFKYSVTEQQSTGHNDQEELFDILYSNSKLIIESNNKIELINIYNIDGKIVKSINCDKTIISTNELSSGIYFVKISDIFNNIYTKKINIY
tara:strand:- start:384 stop:1184 length:801 start_codon:yes stop_codon:yes gene_type:complete